MSKYYYGNGESFVFTFAEEEDIKVFRWTQKDERWQYGDETSLAVGGSKSGEAALFITNYFKNGRSGTSDTYDNI